MIDFADGADDDQYPTVPRVPPRCPNCKVHHSRVQGQSRSGRIRYHVCYNCGRKFRSIEVEPPSLPPSQKN
jgi:hypothetical protein